MSTMDIETADPDLLALEEELTEAAQRAIHGGDARRTKRHLGLSRMGDYAAGKAGIPEVPEGSTDEVEEIAKCSVMNMIGVVIDSFTYGMAVVGFRSPGADDDEPAWQLWLEQGLAARQSEVHRTTNTYGISFVSVLPNDDGRPEIHTWSPLDVDARYEDPRHDLFPETATLWRVVEGGHSVLLLDAVTAQVGFVPARSGKKSKKAFKPGDVELQGDSWEHGATYNGVPVCPVVAFPNERDTEDRDPRGEVEPLIRIQRAINSVNFDRLTGSRFSVFVQKMILGWNASKDTLLKASAARVWTIDEDPSTLKVETFPSSPIEPYNGVITALKEQVALEACIPIYQATGSVANVSENTVAMVDNAYQSKLAIKRDTAGESWGRVLHIGVVMDGGEAPAADAEILWRDTRPRTLGVVVDGISKLSAEGVPIEELLDLVPSLSQPKVDAIRRAIQRRDGGARFEALAAAGRGLPPAAVSTVEPVPASTDGIDAGDLKARFDALGVAVSAGVEPEDAARRLGLEGITFTGAVPASLRLPEGAAGDLEEK